MLAGVFLLLAELLARGVFVLGVALAGELFFEDERFDSYDFWVWTTGTSSSDSSSISSPPSSSCISMSGYSYSPSSSFSSTAFSAAARASFASSVSITWNSSDICSSPWYCSSAAGSSCCSSSSGSWSSSYTEEKHTHARELKIAVYREHLRW